MARARLLKPDFFLDEDLARLPAEARLLFAGLWTLADRDGRLEDRPGRIRAQIFPYSPDCNVEGLLKALTKPREHSKHGFIVRYEIEGKRFIQVRAFKAHQKIHPNEPASQIHEIPALAVQGADGVWRIPEMCEKPKESGESQPLVTNGDQRLPMLPEAEAEAESKAEAVNPPTPLRGARPMASLAPALSWSNEAANDWTDRHGGKPPGPMFKALGALVPPKGPHVWSRVRPVLRFYLATRELDFLNWSKFASGFGTLESEMLTGPPARASPAAQARVEQAFASAKGGLIDERGVDSGLDAYGGGAEGSGLDAQDGRGARKGLPRGIEPPERR